MVTRNQIILSAALLAGTLLGCGTTRTALPHRVSPSPPNPLKQLQNNINAILSDSIFTSSHAGIKIVSLDSGQVFFEHDNTSLMNPASNIKLITAACALAVLDTAYQFKTSVFVNEATRNDDRVQSIYLKGYGDPNLTTSDLDSLAGAVYRTGIRTIAGNMIVDDSFFDDDYWGAGWSWDDASDPDAPFINALSVNKNCISVNVTTDANSISVSLEPKTEFVTVINKATLALDSVRLPLKIRRLTMTNENIILIEGEMYRYSQITRNVPLLRPEFYAGTLFKESLRRAGIFFSGNIVNGVVPEGIREIAWHFQPLQQVIESMNKPSDNLCAENTLKVIGALKNGLPGSAKSGVLVEKVFLSGLGIDTTKFSLVDGSGTSRYNLLTADQLVHFLSAMKKQPRLFPIFYNSLPIAGVDGTIANRMNTSPVLNNLRAKTGTLLGASCLSGYVRTRDGEMLAFAMMMQNFITSPSDYRLAQDKIGSLLAGFSRTKIHQPGP
jgi:serine-type D-Ala-D-Ala carboxypeptidase/endopeptidase (penicillin-binding protein 4)